MRAFLAAACILVLVASATPVSADEITVKVRCQPDWRSICSNGTATSIYGTSAAVAQFDVRDGNGWLSIGSTSAFPVSWVKERVVAGEHNAWKVRVTGTSSHGAVDLQGIWTPLASIDMCTASIPAYCTAQATGPIALTGHAGGYSLELAGVAYDTYSYTTHCFNCDFERVRELLEEGVEIRQ